MKIGIIGLGPFCRQNYMKFIKEYQQLYDIQIGFVCELENNKESTLRFLKEYPLKVAETLFMDSEERFLANMSSSSVRGLGKLVSSHGIDLVILSTEPKAHYKYLKFLLRKGVHVIVDKPPVAGFDYDFNTIIGGKMMLEFKDLQRVLKTTNAKCVVATQRRCHQGFNLVYDELRQVVERYNVPLSFISCFHSDGMLEYA